MDSSTGERQLPFPGERVYGPTLKPAKKADPEEIAKLVGGVLNIVLTLGDMAIRRLRGRKLRQPTRDQVDDIAEPLASLAIRHLDMTKFGPDLADIVAAGGAASGYMREGPMTEPMDDQPAVHQVGMEHEVEEVPTTQIMPTPEYEAAYGSTPKVTYLS